jgi:hypothetical protein
VKYESSDECGLPVHTPTNVPAVLSPFTPRRSVRKSCDVPEMFSASVFCSVRPPSSSRFWLGERSPVHCSVFSLCQLVVCAVPRLP